MAHGLVLQTQADAPPGRLADWAARREIMGNAQRRAG